MAVTIGRLSAENDNIIGTGADEVIEVPSSNANLSGGDTLLGGGGFDTLLFERSADLSVAYVKLTGMSGIEEIDVTASRSVLLSLNDAAVLQSENNRLRITFDDDPLSLDLRDLTPGTGRVELWGSGTVTLYDAPAQTVSFASGASGGRVIGGSGRDTLSGSGARDFLEGRDGDDVLSGGGGGDGLTGGDDQDRLSGGGGSDTLSGGNGFDVLSGDSGNNNSTGGAQSDTFVVTSSETLTIIDFDPTDAFERIDLRAFAGVGFGDLEINASASNAVVTLPGARITLRNTDPADLGASHFIFAGDGVKTLAAALGETAGFEFSEAADSFRGTGGDDVFEVRGNFAKLSDADGFAGRGGIDTLRIWGEDRALSEARATGMSGIEIIDMSGATGALEAQITQGMIDSSSTGTITVKHGANDLTMLTGNVDSAASVIVEGTGTVTLRDVDNQGVTISDNYGGRVEGQNKNDVIVGGAKDDRISGSGGDDLLQGMDGNDVLSGGFGNDTLEGGTGTNVMTGGSGTDRFVAVANSQNTIADFAGRADFERIDLRALSGVEFDDLNIARNGADSVITVGSVTIRLRDVTPGSLSAGDFIFEGEAASQQFILSDGADSLTGSDADDLFDLVGATSQLDVSVDRIDGGGGTDTLRVFGADRMLGAVRLDALNSIEVIDLTQASGSHDIAVDAANAAQSDSGFLTLRFGAAPLSLNTGGVTSASQVVLEGTGLVTLSSGTPGQMVSVSDTVNGLVQAGNDATVILGGAGNDTLRGDEGYDQIEGGAGDDVLNGGEGNDILTGGAGDDILSGGEGNDLLFANSGADTLTGGAGFDQYIVRAGAQGTVLTDYNPRNIVERIDVTALENLRSIADVTLTNQGNDVRVRGEGLDLMIRDVQAGQLDDGDFLFKGEDPLLFNVAAGTTGAQLQQLFDGVPAGAIIRIAPGIYSVTETLTITRSDITVEGAGEGRTIFRTDIRNSDAGSTILVHAEDLQIRYAPLSTAATEGSFQVQLPDVEALRLADPDSEYEDFEVGDLVYLAQANDAEWLASVGSSDWNTIESDDPVEAENFYLREARSKIVSIDDNGVATLAEALPYTFEAGRASLAKSTFLSNVNLSGFTIQGNFGADPDPLLFENTLSGWASIAAIEFDGVRDSSMSNITLNNPAAHGFKWQRAYETTGDNLTAVGAHNKDGSSGYHFYLQESFANTLTHLSSTDARHAVLFSSYSAEHYNNIQLDFTNRDINFHGSPDDGNTIVVDVNSQVYDYGNPDAEQWQAVHPGVRGLHPASDIEGNDVTFKFARSGERSDRIVGHVDGADVAMRDGSDEFIGQGGNDTARGDEGNDTLRGNGGNDILEGGIGQDDLRGGDGNDVLRGGEGNDVLRGGEGNDTIDGGLNGDNLIGGAGRDTFVRAYADFTDTIFDFEAGARGDVMLIRGAAYTNFNELMLRQQGADVILEFGPTGSTIFKDIRLADLVPANFAFTGDNQPGQSISLRATELQAVGTDRSDDVFASRAHMNSPLFTVVAGGGYDRLTVAQSSLNANLSDTGTYSGIEEFDLSTIATLGLVVENPLVSQSSSGKLYLAIGDTGTPVLLDVGPLGRGKNVFIDGARDVQLTGGREHTVKSADDTGTNITGDVLRDIIYGGRANDVIDGGGGNDVVFGSAGDDTLRGGGGNDTINGGPGSDIIYIDDVGDRVAESNRWDGTDHVIASVDFRMGRAHIETMELTGTAVLGAGNGLRNTITGNDQDNILDGGKNVDTLIGGAGDDTYLLRSPGDNAVETANGGIDTVRAFRSIELGAHVENLYIQTLRNAAGEGVPGVNGIGNSLDNVIVGNPFDNTIAGREGNDTLRGQAGADRFVFDRAPGPGNIDRILDFNVNEANEGDRLFMDDSVFTGLGLGTLGNALFQLGTAATDANDRFIFQQSTGRLWFDVDGVGGQGQELVAVFEQNASLSASDIEII